MVVLLIYDCSTHRTGVLLVQPGVDATVAEHM